MEQHATRATFFVIGLAMAAWAPLIPFAKSRLELDDRALGLLLLCLGGGSLVTMPFAGALAARFGCRRVILAAGGLVSVILPLLATVSHVPLFVATLALFGAALGIVDCVVNIQAIMVERASGRAMMSGFHGMFSVGGIVGAAGATGLLSLGATPFATALCVVTATVLALVAAAPHLLPYGSSREGPALAVPHGTVLFLGALCFIVFLAEGAVLDWSAVFLTTLRGMAPSHSGWGYAAFAATMTAGRLTGDAIVKQLGGQKVIALGGILSGGGLLLAALVPFWGASLLGYVLVGAGCSNIVPVLFTAVGRQRAMPENAAVPAITTMGYAGILAGPAGIGFIAQASSLPTAFVVLAFLLLGVATSARFLRV